MSNNTLDIEILDQEIDLFPGEIFTLTLQATDIIGLTGTKASFSKTIDVPITDNNSRILGITNVMNSQSTRPYRALKTKVIQNGVEIIPQGTTILEATSNDVFKITIYSGDLSAVDLLKDLPLSLLDLSSSDFNYTLSNAVAFSNASTGVVWGVCGYEESTQKVFPNSIDIRHSYFGVYLESLLLVIASRLKITILGFDNLTTPELSNLVIPLSNVPKVDLTFQARRGFTARNEFNDSYPAVNASVIQFGDVLEGNGAGEYTPGTGIYASVEVFNFDVTYRISGTKTGANAELRFNVHDNRLQNYAEHIVAINETAFDFEISTTGLYTGQSEPFQLEYVKNAGDTFVINANSTVEFKCRDEAATYEDNNFAGGSLVSVARSLPDITAFDLTTTLRNIYALITQSNSISGETSVLPFNDLLIQPEVDWSSKIDLSKKADIIFVSTALAQVNRFSYKDDEDLDFNPNSAFDISNDNLQAVTDIAELAFAASQETIAGSNIATARISLFEETTVLEGTTVSVSSGVGGFHVVDLGETNIDVRANDTLIIGNAATTIIEVNYSVVNSPETTIRVFSNIDISSFGVSPFRIVRLEEIAREPRLLLARSVASSSVVYTNGVAQTTVTDFKVLNFRFSAESIDLSWSQFLDDNYTSFVFRVQQEKVLRAFFNLNELDIRQLDFLRPHYIEEFGNHFYLNKVNKYRIDVSTECQLISLHFGFGGNEISEWFNSGYTEFITDRNVILRAFKDTAAAASANSNVFGVIVNEVYRLVYELQYNATFDMNFNAVMSTDTTPAAAANFIFDSVLSGNAAGDYNDVTGAYTLADAFTGTIKTICTVINDPGGAVVVDLVSDLQGVLATVTIPNNTTQAFTLEFTGAFSINEVLTVEQDKTGPTVVAGSTFSFVYISGGTITNITDVTATVLDSVSAPISNAIILTSGSRQVDIITINTSEADATLEVKTADQVDYTVNISLNKESAGG